MQVGIMAAFIVSIVSSNNIPVVSSPKNPQLLLLLLLSHLL